MTDTTDDSEELNSRICNGTTVPCEIRESFINGHSRGVGIFSINRLEPETLIWKYNVDEYCVEEARRVLNSLTSLEEKRLWVEHVFAWRDKIVVLKDDMELINHSPEPNVYFSQKDGNIRAQNVILSGEKLLIDYCLLGPTLNFTRRR
jgi:Proteins containing SET domain